MKRLLGLLGLVIVTLIGSQVLLRSSDGICTSEEPIFMPDCRGMKSFEGLGFFQKTGEGGIHKFRLTYLRNGTTFNPYNKTVKLKTIHTPEVENGEIYFVSANGNPGAKYYETLTLEEYDEIVLDFKGYYDICWDYDCKGEIPWEKKEEKNRFFLKRVGGSYSSGTCPPGDILAKGNVNILTIFAYDGSAISDKKRIQLEEEIRYVMDWYKSRARMATGYEVLNLKIDFYDRQIPIPKDYNLCSMNSVENLVDNINSTDDYDIIAIVHVLTSDPQCPPHPDGNVISVYIRGDQLESEQAVETLVRSFAHEVAHLFGATDKYTSPKVMEIRKVGCKLEPEILGWDIMCQRVPDEEKYLGFRYPPLEELNITGHIAKELGWYDGDGDGLLEVFDPCPMDRRNMCIELGGGK